MKKRMLILAALLCVTGLTAACENTWHGMGRDMERAGEDMQNQYN